MVDFRASYTASLFSFKNIFNVILLCFSLSLTPPMSSFLPYLLILSPRSLSHKNIFQNYKTKLKIKTKNSNKIKNNVKRRTPLLKKYCGVYEACLGLWLLYPVNLFISKLMKILMSFSELCGEL